MLLQTRATEVISEAIDVNKIINKEVNCVCYNTVDSMLNTTPNNTRWPDTSSQSDFSVSIKELSYF